MAAITKTQCKLRFGISTGDTSENDTSEDSALDQLITFVQALAEKSLGFPIEQGVRGCVLDGTGREWLCLPHKPVTAVRASGNTTSGSATVTGLPAAAVSAISAGWPVCGEGVPAGATVASASGTSCTLSAAATRTGSGVTLTFGLSVWLDTSGQANYGFAEDAWPDDTLLVPGVDYSLRADAVSADGLTFTSNAGMLWRAAFWPRHQRRQWGMLAGNLPGPLPSSGGAALVRYVSGFNPVPSDLQFALIEAVSIARDSAPNGRLKGSESFDGYSVSYLAQAAEAGWQGVLAGNAAGILAKYRRPPV